MSVGARSLATLQAAYAKATDSAAAYDRMTASMGQMKLAGSDTIAALQTTLAVARSELRRFANNRDVQVVVEIAREHLSEAWFKARPILQRALDASGLRVAAAVVADRTQDVRGWLDRQRRFLMKPITVRMELARRAVDVQVAAAKARLESLKQYRAVRITLAAFNAMKAPTQAALATIGPIARLAGHGIVVALKATHFGVAVGVNKARALLTGFANHARSTVSGISGLFSRMFSGFGGIAALLGGGAIAGGLSGVVGYSIKLAADAEQARVSFTTMLGSVDKANALMGEINQFAASTPFQTPELVDASKKLLAFGVAQEQIIPTMRSLGDIAAGLNIPIGELSELYGKAKVQGRLFAEDINQLTGRGIPVIQEFAKQFGVAEGDVKGLVESGKIGFPQLQQAIASLTGEGGKFSGLMAAQSQTVAGLWSSLQDTVTLSLTRIGEVITDKLDLRGAIAGITNSLIALSSAAMPIIESFIGGLASSGNAGQTAGNLVLGGAEMIAKGLAYAIDYSNLAVAGFKALQAGGTYAVFGLVKAVDLIGGGLVKLINLMPGVSVQWTSFTGELADGLLADAKRLQAEAGEAFGNFQTSDSSAKVGAFFDQVRANAAQAAAATTNVGTAAQQTALKIENAAATTAAANEKVADTLADLQKSVTTFGLSEGQSKIMELQGQGANGDQIAQAQKLLDLKAQLEGLNQIDAGDPMTTFAAKMEKLQQLYAAGKVTADQFAAIRDSANSTLNEKLTDSARSITEGVRTPLEKYQAEVDNLNTLLERGLITQETFDRATAQAKGNLDPAGAAVAPQVYRANSAEAQRLAYDNSRGVQRLTKDDVPKKAFAEAQEHTRLLERIEKNIRPAEPPQVVNL